MLQVICGRKIQWENINKGKGCVYLYIKFNKGILHQQTGLKKYGL